MDDLEKYILNNRSDLDIHEPDTAVWERIESGLGGKRRIFLTVAARAAVVIIAAGVAFALLARQFGTPERNPEMKLVRETDIYYNSLISSMYDEARPLLTSHPEISTELTTGMNELDSIAVQIRRDLNDQAANREVIEALIHNYRLRIELLEDMLGAMKESDTTANKIEGYEL